jgi:glycogen debranching enzyme
MMYWSAYNLMRQCMLPPEGEARHNYYVFSREPTWGWGHGGQVFHESLAMLAYVFLDPQSALNSQRVYMERQWENGYIPYRTGPYLDETIFARGSFTTSAPWYSYENWALYRETGNRTFLRDAYESGMAFYTWWLNNRDQDGDGLAEWGGHAVLESVRDANVAVWDKVGWPANFEAPELNSMLVKEARALANMAEALGDSTGARRWRREAERREKAIQKTFWDDETHFFYYVDKEDHDFTFEDPGDLKRREITGFIPLWAGTATEAQARRLVEEHLTDSTSFWRPYGVPSLSANDPYYDPQGYWNGPVWVEWQFLVMRGLQNYGYHAEAAELADRVFSNVIHHLKTSHTFWEFYSPDARWAGHHQTYIWTGLVARMVKDVNDADRPAEQE